MTIKTVITVTVAAQSRDPMIVIMTIMKIMRLTIMVAMVIMFTKAAPVKCPHDVAQTSTKTRHDGER